MKNLKKRIARTKNERRVAGWGGAHRGPGWRMAAAYKWHRHTMDAAFEPRDGPSPQFFSDHT